MATPLYLEDGIELSAVAALPEGAAFLGALVATNSGGALAGRAQLGIPAPIFSDASPVVGTPPAGVPGQLYYHKRSATLTDLYQYTGTQWVLRIAGNSTNNAPQLVITFAAGGQSSITIPISASQAGTYALPASSAGLTGITYSRAGVELSGTVTLAASDLLTITATTGSAPATLTLSVPLTNSGVTPS